MKIGSKTVTFPWSKAKAPPSAADSVWSAIKDDVGSQAFDDQLKRFAATVPPFTPAELQQLTKANQSPELQAKVEQGRQVAQLLFRVVKARGHDTRGLATSSAESDLPYTAGERALYDKLQPPEADSLVSTKKLLSEIHVRSLRQLPTNPQLNQALDTYAELIGDERAEDRREAISGFQPGPARDAFEKNEAAKEQYANQRDVKFVQSGAWLKPPEREDQGGGEEPLSFSLFEKDH